MRLFLIAVTTSLLTACVSGGIDRDSMNQMVEVIYAEVTHTKPVKFESKTGEAAIIGAIGGAVEEAHYGDFEDIVAGAMVGAIISSVIVSVEEGPRDGLLLKLTASDSTQYKVVSNRTDIFVGDCLELIQGPEVSILPVDSRLCQIPPSPVVATVSNSSVSTATKKLTSNKAQNAQSKRSVN